VLLSSDFQGGDATLLRAGAKRVHEVLGVPLVAMGHVHTAEDTAIGGGRYLNSGTWMDRRLPATFVRVVGASAEVVEWVGATV
jgi:UDP-2,3-diacylglucosamine pyrophosphatase LpxH